MSKVDVSKVDVVIKFDNHDAKRKIHHVLDALGVPSAAVNPVSASGYLMYGGDGKPINQTFIVSMDPDAFAQAAQRATAPGWHGPTVEQARPPAPLGKYGVPTPALRIYGH